MNSSHKNGRGQSELSDKGWTSRPNEPGSSAVTLITTSTEKVPFARRTGYFILLIGRLSHQPLLSSDQPKWHEQSSRKYENPDRYIFDKSDAGDRSRTCDPRITNALLYQLSYSGVEAEYVKHRRPATPVGHRPATPAGAAASSNRP